MFDSSNSKTMHPRHPPDPETQIPRYKSTGKWDQNLNLNLYHVMPRKLSFSIRWISGMQEHFQWKLSCEYSQTMEKQNKNLAELVGPRVPWLWKIWIVTVVSDLKFETFNVCEYDSDPQWYFRKKENISWSHIYSDYEKSKSSRSCVTWNLRHLTYVNMTPNDTWEKERPFRGSIHMTRRNWKHIPMYVNMMPPTIFEEQGKFRPKRGGVNCKGRDYRVEKIANVGIVFKRKCLFNLRGTHLQIRKESLGTWRLSRDWSYSEILYLRLRSLKNCGHVRDMIDF